MANKKTENRREDPKRALSSETADQVGSRRHREVQIRKQLGYFDNPNKVLWLPPEESGMAEPSQFAHESYHDWRMARIRKTVEILGYDWFKGKKVLELACALGQTGSYFRTKLGAKVLFAEGRPELLEAARDTIKKQDPSVNDDSFIVINQDKDWEILDPETNNRQELDLILNWGVNYHLVNWKRDIEKTLMHANKVSFETHVTDSNDVNVVSYRHEYGLDQGLLGIGACPSVAGIEKTFKDNGFVFKRYDDADLDIAGNSYSWEAKNNNSAHTHNNHDQTSLLKRRYWFLEKKKTFFNRFLNLSKK